MTYLAWLAGIVAPDNSDIEYGYYQKVLEYLYIRSFNSKVDLDRNRASDGIDLRELYEYETGFDCDKSGPCSILEVLIGLAKTCEEDIMHDPDYGDRTYLWFWDIMQNLGLTEYDDYMYDLDEVSEIVDQFINRTYGRDGLGGPFYVPGFRGDMRKIDLWYQLNYFIKSRYF